MKGYQVARLLAYVTGLVNQELLLQVEYLVAENRILRAHAPVRLRLSNEERSTLAEIGRRLGRKGLEKVALVAKPETILNWFRKLVAQKFDGSKYRSYPGRPRIAAEVEALIVQMARDNSGWGYDRIAGALAHLGYEASDQTVANVLRRHRIAPAPKRSQTTTWKDFIASHMAVLAGYRFLYCRGAHLARSGDVPRFICHSAGNEAGDAGRHHPPSDGGVDGAGSPERHRRRMRSPPRTAIPSA